MRKRIGGVWEEREKKDWFWVQKRGDTYFSSDLITCVEAVRIFKGRQPAPRAYIEVRNIASYKPVSEGVIELLARALEKAAVI